MNVLNLRNLSVTCSVQLELNCDQQIERILLKIGQAFQGSSTPTLPYKRKEEKGKGKIGKLSTGTEVKSSKHHISQEGNKRIHCSSAWSCSQPFQEETSKTMNN